MKYRFKILVSVCLMLAVMLSTFACKNSQSTELIIFDAYFGYSGDVISSDNAIRKLIEKETGISVNEEFFISDSTDDSDKIKGMIESGKYPDYINSLNINLLYDAGALIPLDDYIDEFPNIKALYTENEWDSFRQADGKIYWIGDYNCSRGELRGTKHNGEAFYIQVRVLEWGGYPEINTIDEYFDLIERYVEANPTNEDGQEVIPYTLLCNESRSYFSRAPIVLEGFADNTSLALDDTDPDNPIVFDYNVTDTAKEYYRRLNEEYKKSLIDPDFATQTYEEYIEKLKSGRVLGMFDQGWNFIDAVNPEFEAKGYDALGYTYVPLGLTTEDGMTNRYHSYEQDFSNISGVGISVDCEDPHMALWFINKMLDQDMHDLRMWGIEGEDYLVDADGYFYRTEEMRTKWQNADYLVNHCCSYMFIPALYGTSTDGKNAMRPEEQATENWATLPEPVARCYEAYGVSGDAEMLGSDKSAEFDSLYQLNPHYDEDVRNAWEKHTEVMREWLPKLVAVDDFETAWEQYMKVYDEIGFDVCIEDEQNWIDSIMNK